MKTYQDGLREAAAMLEISNNRIQLVAGKLTGSEMLSVKAVLAWRQREILAKAEQTENTKTYLDGLREAAQSLELSNQQIRLAAGELTPSEMRAVQTVLEWLSTILYTQVDSFETAES